MPNRIIKESVCVSETIDQLNWFEEVFFYRLMVNCDDYGRFDARPAVLKARLFPLKERITLKDVSNALTKLVDVGIVRLYECDSKPYLYLPTWEVHQTVRAKKSKFPAPGESVKSSDSKCKQMIANVPVFDNRESESVSVSEYESNPTPNTTCAAAVCADFLDRINSTPSASCLDELKVYAEEMGEAVCKRAFDVALDNKKTTWPYIRGILRRLQSQGVKCLADWDALEEKRAEASARGGAASVQRAPERKSFAAIAAEIEAELKGGGGGDGS